MRIKRSLADKALALRRSKERMSPTSLLLRSRSERESIINLPAGELRVLEKDIRDRLACGIVESLYSKTVISTRWFCRCLWCWYKD